MIAPSVRAAWGEWIAGLADWQLCGALTIDPARHPQYRERPMPPDVFKRRVERWLGDFRRATGRDVQAVVAVESHRNGWPHAHPLLALPAGLQAGWWGPERRYGDVAALGQLWYQANGYARLEAPRNAGATAAYAAKYLAKDVASGDVVLWGLRPATLKGPARV